MTRSKAWAWASALVLCFCFSFKVQAQLQTHTIPDDGYVSVPLQFGFPFYGQVFTHSWMYDNGVVGFMDPGLGFTQGQQYNSLPLNGNLSPSFSFMIAPLWTDLVNYGSGTFTTQGSTQFQRYQWTNISQFGYPDRLNTFGLEITPSGSIAVDYSLINIQGYPVSAGTVGDPTAGQYYQHYYQPPGGATTQVSAWTYATAVDPCVADPLNSPACPGYAAAYHDQQCSITALYATTCPGYQQAYYDQQCSINPLYDSTCPGYQQAFYDQQCSANPLYDSGCPNYAIVKASTEPPESTADSTQAPTVAIVTESPAAEPMVSVTSPTSVSPAAVVSVIAPTVPAPSVSATAPRVTAAESAQQETRAAEQKSQEKKTEQAVARRVPPGASREQQARAAAAEAERAAEESAQAATFEAQQAAQSAVLGLMNFNPAFSAYQNSLVPDINAAAMARQYNRAPVDNARAQRQMNQVSDRAHREMVEQQYRR